jgi:hypothetical protein
MKVNTRNIMHFLVKHFTLVDSFWRRRADRMCRLGSVFVIACVILAGAISPAHGGDPKVVVYFDEELTQRVTCGGGGPSLARLPNPRLSP